MNPQFLYNKSAISQPTQLKSQKEFIIKKSSPPQNQKYKIFNGYYFLFIRIKMKNS